MLKNKSFTAAVICTLIVSFSAASCTKPEAANTDIVETRDGPLITQIKTGTGIVEIRERMFISQVNDVYLNAGDYLGKTIKLEGLFKQQSGDKKSYWFVIRYGPGCCGYDGTAGFEVAWADEKARPYPAVDSWVEATGVLKTYAEDGYDQYLYLDLSSLKVLGKRGAETVIQ